MTFLIHQSVAILHFADSQVIWNWYSQTDDEYTKWGVTSNPSKTDYLVELSVGESLELRNWELRKTTEEIESSIGQGK